MPKGFTLIEITVVVAIMAMLAGVVIVAINPSKQFASARNTQRMSDLGKIQASLNDYAVGGNGSFPASVTTTLQMIGTATSGCNVICGPDTLLSIINSFTDNNSATGTYTSSIKDAGASQTWTNLSWTPTAPYNKELPNTTASEIGYPAGNAVMTGNKMLLHMNESSGILGDLSGSGNAGVVTGAIAYGASGKLKTAISFAGGANNYISATNNASLNLSNTGGSIALWIKPTINLAANTGMGIMRKPDYGANLATPGGYGMEIYRATTGGPQNIKVHLGWNNGTTNSQQTIVGATNLISGNWYHIVMTWTATTMTVYVNSVPDATATRVNGQLLWASNTANLYVGRDTSSISANRAWYSGAMDEIALFNRTLSQTEIIDFYKRGALKLRQQVRSCNDSACVGENFAGPDGTAGTYYDDLNNTSLTPPSFALTNIPVNRYFQYKAFFDTDTATFGPALQNITMTNDGSGAINTTSTAMTANSCVDLTGAPFDPSTGNSAKTYYAVQRIDSANLIGNGLLIRACSPELGKTIEINQ